MGSTAFVPILTFKTVTCVDIRHPYNVISCFFSFFFYFFCRSCWPQIFPFYNYNGRLKINICLKSFWMDKKKLLTYLSLCYLTSQLSVNVVHRKCFLASLYSGLDAHQVWKNAFYKAFARHVWESTMQNTFLFKV